MEAEAVPLWGPPHGLPSVSVYRYRFTSSTSLASRDLPNGIKLSRYLRYQQVLEILVSTVSELAMKTRAQDESPA